MKLNLRIVGDNYDADEGDLIPSLGEALMLTPLQLQLLYRWEARLSRLEMRIQTIASTCPLAIRIEGGG